MIRERQRQEVRVTLSSHFEMGRGVLHVTVGRYIDDERNVKKKKSSRRRRGRSWRGVRTRGRLFLVPGGRGPRSRGKTASWLFLRDQETFPYPKNGTKKVPRRKTVKLTLEGNGGPWFQNAQ